MKYTILLATLFLVSCAKQTPEADAYGNFEATEITVSSESTGKIEQLNLTEGQQIKQGQVVGQIDTLQLYLTKQQLVAQQAVIASRTANVQAQQAVQEEQLKTALIEQQRILNMYAEKAATKRQVDEINGKVNVLRQQIKSVSTQNQPITAEQKSVQTQIAKINDQINKATLINPTTGTILTQYAEPGELTTFGKPLYKIANLQELTLRVYVSETQLPSLTIGKKVNVTIDNPNQNQNFTGTLSWISAQAEFTPKVIQTKQERINLVYAVKIKVPNPQGILKIGMPAEVHFSK